MPLPVVAALRVADFEPDVKTAIAAVPYAAAGKIGLQFSRRFWEEDDAIFGGISKTDQEIAQIVYPSSGYLGAKGVLIGYYQNGVNAAAMARRTARGAPGPRAEPGRTDPSAVSQAFRDGVPGVLAERALVARRLGAVLARRQARAPIRSSAARPGGCISPAITSAT